VKRNLKTKINAYFYSKRKINKVFDNLYNNFDIIKNEKKRKKDMAD